jgi:hypothetical protein
MKDPLRSKRLDRLMSDRKELLDRAARLGILAEPAPGYLRAGKVMMTLGDFRALLDDVAEEPLHIIRQSEN